MNIDTPDEEIEIHNERIVSTEVAVKVAEEFFRSSEKLNSTRSVKSGLCGGFDEEIRENLLGKNEKT